MYLEVKFTKGIPIWYKYLYDPFLNFYDSIGILFDHTSWDFLPCKNPFKNWDD